jgi:hypothetical protein
VWARPDPVVTGLALFVLWLTCGGLSPVAAASVPSWQNERPIPRAFGGGARVAVTSAGEVAVAWQDVEKGLSVAVRPVGGRFGSPQRLSGSGRRVQGQHDVVADSRGALIVVWADTECCRVPADTRVWASTRKPGGRFSRPVALSRPFEGSDILEPAVATGDDGALTVAWPVQNFAPPGVDEAVIEVADRHPGGGFGAATQVSPPNIKAREPRIARGPSGETVVLWSSGSQPCPPFPCYELFASTRAPGSEWGAPERVAVAAGSGDIPGWLAASQVLIASDGTVFAVWREGLGCGYCSGADVKVARRPPGQRFESPQTLGHLGGSGPWLALDPAGRTLALWGDANTERDAVELNPRVIGAEAPPGQAFEKGRAVERGGDALGIAIGGGHAVAAWTRDETVVAAVRRHGGYCRQSISRRPAQADGDIAANRRGDAVAVWARAKRPSDVMVAMGPADGRAPVIKRLTVRLRHFDEAHRPSPRGAVRATLRFILSEAAEVRVSLERRAGGRFRPVAALTRSMPAGTNHVTYSRLARGLRPGSYRAVVGARDCGGRRSRSPALPFVVTG